jgi:hypothetical protein
MKETLGIDLKGGGNAKVSRHVFVKYAIPFPKNPTQSHPYTTSLYYSLPYREP